MHPDAIREAYAENGTHIELPEQFGDFEDVPELVAKAIHGAHGEGEWDDVSEIQRKEKEKRTKRVLNGTAVSKMTVGRLAVSDPNGEVQGWISDVGEVLGRDE